MSEVTVEAGLPEGREVEVLAVPWFVGTEGPPGWWREPAASWLEGRSSEDGEEPSGWVELGREERPDLYVVRIRTDRGPATVGLRAAAGEAARAARERRARSIGLVLDQGLEDAAGAWQAAAEGLALGDWRFDELREAESRRPPLERRILYGVAGDIRGHERGAVERANRLALAQNAARGLVVRPGNLVTPRQLAEAARRLGEEHEFAVTVWGEEKLRAEGFGGLLAVARGSAEEPFFLILEHEGEGGSPHVVVGKGVTFDAGGISLKPALGMEAMKYDMAGAAATIGVLVAAARLGVRQRVVGLIPTTENLPSGTATRPGDVIRGLSGKSIEVINTDAEGRLILSDALTYAQGLEPRAIVDLATLTGACVVALGHHAIGLMSPHDELATELEEAGGRSGERTWRLPLWPEYRKQLDSDIADIKNTGGRPASAITAGWFLREFVGDDVPWAHLDIAGTAWAEEARGWQPKGATGVGVRLIHEWLRLRD